MMETTVKRIMVLVGLGSLLLAAFQQPILLADSPQTLATTTTGSGKPAIHWHDNLRSGWLESRRRGVPMVIFITSENCTYCDAMKRETWCNESVRQRIANGFVAIRLSPRQNSATLKRIKVQLYPTTLVGVPRGRVIGQRVGYQPPAALHQLLSEAK